MDLTNGSPVVALQEKQRNLMQVQEQLESKQADFNESIDKCFCLGPHPLLKMAGEKKKDVELLS